MKTQLRLFERMSLGKGTGFLATARFRLLNFLQRSQRAYCTTGSICIPIREVDLLSKVKKTLPPFE